MYKSSARTLGSFDVGTRPAGERDVDDQEGEANERHEVIKLVRTVHGDAENDDQEVEAEQHLQQRTMTRKLKRNSTCNRAP